MTAVLTCLGGCGNPYDLPVLASSRPPQLRVLIGRNKAGARLEIRDQPWQIRSEGGPRWERTARADLIVDVRATPQGIALGPERTGARVLRVRAERHVTVDGVRYAGDLVLHLDGDRVRLVNEVDLETYVAGVIGNEMVPGAPPAAYRTQAVAARTYAWIKLQDPTRVDRVFDLYDDQASQVYTGLDPRYGVAFDDMRRFTSGTAGVILTWQSQPFPAYYSSTCGGHTTEARTSRLDPQGASEPLRGVRCEFCRTSPRYEWTKTVREEDVVAGLAARGRPIRAPVHAIEVRERGAGEWAAEVWILHGPNREIRKLPGTEFRSALRLDSHNIVAIRKTSAGWEIQGRGWGHGVGLCQWGAMEMGRRGFSESEILAWYYPGASFTRVY